MTERVQNHLSHPDYGWIPSDMDPTLAILILYSREQQLSKLSEADMFIMYEMVMEWRKYKDPIIKESDRALSYEIFGESFLKSEVQEAEIAWNNLSNWHRSGHNPKVETQASYELRGRELLFQFEDEFVDILVIYFSIYDKYLSDNKVGEVIGRRSISTLDISQSIASANGQSFGKKIFAELSSIAKGMNESNIPQELDRFLKIFISFANHLDVKLDLVEAMRRKLEGNHANRDFGNHELIIYGKRIPDHEAARLFGFDNIFSKRLRSLYSDYRRNWVMKDKLNNGKMLPLDLESMKVETLTDAMKAPFADLFEDKNMYPYHDYNHGTTVTDGAGDQVSIDKLEVLAEIDARFAQLVDSGEINPSMFLHIPVY